MANEQNIPNGLKVAVTNIPSATKIAVLGIEENGMRPLGEIDMPLKPRVIILTENTVLSSAHENAILMVTGTINLTVPSGLTSTFVSCTIDVKSGQCTIVQGAGTTITGYASLVLITNDRSSLYKESSASENFRLI